MQTETGSLEDIPIDSQNKAPNSSTLADGILASPAESTPIEVDRDIASLSDPQGDGKTNDEVPPAPSHLSTPLFAPSPPHVPEQVSGAVILNHQGTTELQSQSSLLSSESDGSQEPPWKCLRMGSPLLAVPMESCPLQMVLGTKGAAWSLQVEHEKDGKVHDQVSAIVFKHQGAASARDKMRTRLNGFVMLGSQVKSTHVDDDKVGGFSDPASGKT